MLQNLNLNWHTFSNILNIAGTLLYIGFYFMYDELWNTFQFKFQLKAINESQIGIWKSFHSMFIVN